MTESLWTPHHARLAPRAQLPEGTVLVLGDGRRLRRMRQEIVEQMPAASGAIAISAWATPDHLRVVASIDPTDRFGPLLHVSASREATLPSWKDMRLLKDAFYGPYLDAMMVLPVEEDYVNHNEFTMHLWETPERWGLR